MQNLCHLVEAGIRVAAAFVSTVACHACSVNTTIVEVDACSNAEFVVHLAVHTQSNVVALAAAVYHGSLILVVAIGQVVLHRLTATVHAYTVVLRQRGASHGFVQPVNAGTVAIVFVQFQEAAVAVLPGGHGFFGGGGQPHGAFIVGQHKLFGTQHVELVGKLAEAHIGVKRHLSFALHALATLGRDEYHTVGTPGTVDGGGRSVLQHVDALNVGGVEAGHTVLCGETIYHIKRLIALSNGDTATHTNGSLCTRLTVGLYNLHTRHASGQCLCSIRSGHFH